MKNIRLLLVITLANWSVINAQNIIFTDDWFKEELIFLGIDTNNDGEISREEAGAVSSLIIEEPYLEPSITNLSGIEYFINLDSLSCPYHSISYAVLNKNKQLRYLDFSGNYNLDTLLIDSCKLLEILHLKQIGPISDSLNFSFFPNLKLLNIDCSVLDVSHNYNLERLQVNGVNQLDITNNTLLKHLECHNLKDIDLTNNLNLEYLDCLSFGSGTPDRLQHLDISKNTRLKYVDCAQNIIDQIDLSNNPELMTFKGSWNPLGTIDLSNNPKLTSFRCSKCELSDMDLSNNPALDYLHCSSNELRELDVSNNSKLKTLYCGLNFLDSLDLSKCSSLEKLNCGENSLKEIIFPETCNLQEVWCDNNELTNVNIRACRDLEGIHFFYNNLESLDLSKNRKAQWIQIGFNENMEEVCVWVLPLPEGLSIPLHGCPKAYLKVCLDDIQEYIFHEILAYPNPATSWLTLHGMECEKPMSLLITDMKGGIEIVESQISIDKTYEIYIGDLEPGAYTITIQSADLCYSSKFLKQ